ncbi:MAG: hypothetical protein JG769_282 [Oscillospiraceae bacterium]|nr:hypothetical protein [Oscillospiraceae bacterium]
MNDVRAVFEKLGRARFISHLDLLRCMQRAFKRAGLPLWYSQGFNPRAYLMFPLPLSLGIGSICEIMDFTLVDDISCDEIKDRLNKTLPDGIKILSVDAPVKKHTEIAAAVYEIKFFDRNSNIILLFNEFMEQEKIEIQKVNKKKIPVQIDIKPQIEVLEMVSKDGQAVIKLKLPAGTQENLNVNSMLEAFQNFIKSEIDDIFICRTDILCLDGKKFF